MKKCRRPIWENCAPQEFGAIQYAGTKIVIKRSSYFFDLSQFFIALAIVLGVLEKTFFVAEYAIVNTQGNSCECEGEGEGVVAGEVPVRV